MTVNGFFIPKMTKSEFLEEKETILGLVQTSMTNTRLLVMQNYPSLSYVPMKYFDNKYFLDELNQQIKEQDIN